MNNLGNLIASRRKELKLTQKELALKLNVSDKTVSKWETGASYPEVTFLATIAKALDMNLSDFFGVEEMHEQAIDLEEQESYDDIIIGKYKNRVFLTIGLIMVAYILIFTAIVIQNVNLQLVMIGVGVAIYVISLVNFISCNVSFRSFYNQKFYIHNYDYVFYKYSVTIVIILVFPFIIFSLLSSSRIDISTIRGIFFLVSILLVIASYIVLMVISRLANFKIKKDLISWILVSLSLTLFVLMVIDLIPFTMLPLDYILGYIPLFRLNYLNNK